MVISREARVENDQLQLTRSQAEGSSGVSPVALRPPRREGRFVQHLVEEQLPADLAALKSAPTIILLQCWTGYWARVSKDTETQMD